VGQVPEGKAALVIGGGGGGIGRAITRALVAAGSAVAIADIDRQRADEAAAEAGAAGVKAFALAGDVRAPGDIDGFVRDAARELGALDVLVTVVGGQLAFVPAARTHEITTRTGCGVHISGSHASPAHLAKHGSGAGWA
jgi:3-oxoacyl-[acyl-carrier protein] reductase